MVIQVRGTNLNRNKAAHMTALFAATNAILYSKKTLIIQLDSKPSIEDILIGKELSETQIMDEHSFEDIGIEALMIRARSRSIRKDVFDTCCRQLLESTPNLLDIAIGPKNDQFEEELLAEYDRDIDGEGSYGDYKYKGEAQFAEIIDQAKKIYDDIYICTNPYNHKMCEMVNRYTDTQIICIRQGKKETIEDLLANKENPNEPGDYMLVCTNYDFESMFTYKYLKRMYDAKFVGYVGYNAEYKDAYNMGNLLEFIERNASISEDDVSYALFNGVKKIMDRINNGELSAPDTTPDFEEFAKRNKELKLTEFPEVKEEVTRKGLFKRRVVTVEEKDTDENEKPETFIEGEVKDVSYYDNFEEVVEEAYSLDEQEEPEDSYEEEEDVHGEPIDKRDDPEEEAEDEDIKDEEEVKPAYEFEEIVEESEPEPEPKQVNEEELEEAVQIMEKITEEKKAEKRVAAKKPAQAEAPKAPAKEKVKKEKPSEVKAHEKKPADDNTIYGLDELEQFIDEELETIPESKPEKKEAAKPVHIASPKKDTWVCEQCGARISSKYGFCYECGAKKPKDKCKKCGFVFDDEDIVMKFCPECGEKRQ